MKLVKNLNKAYSRYLATSVYQNDLYSVYKTFSKAKEEGYNHCIDLCYKFDGYNFKIIGANSSTFSVAFIGQYEGKKAFFYITKDYDRVMLLEE